MPTVSPSAAATPTPAAAHVLRDNAAWDNARRGVFDGGNPGALQLTGNTAFRNGEAGFHTPTPDAVLRGNVAIDNASADVVGDDAHSSGNTWDGGEWSSAVFRSTDPAAAQGPRRPNGRLPVTDFLTNGRGVGASMLG